MKESVKDIFKTYEITDEYGEVNKRLLRDIASHILSLLPEKQCHITLAKDKRFKCDTCSVKRYKCDWIGYNACRSEMESRIKKEFGI